MFPVLESHAHPEREIFSQRRGDDVGLVVARSGVVVVVLVITAAIMYPLQRKRNPIVVY